MNYLKKTAVCIAAIIAAANGLGYMPYNPVELPAFTADAADIVASGECGAEGDNVVWQLDSEGTLTISGEGEMNSSPWEDYKALIKSIVINEGVTNIATLAFNSCENLSSVTIPKTVDVIGICAFSKCVNLKEVIIPDGVTTIWRDAFYGCSNLTTVIFPDSITHIDEWAFQETPWIEAKRKENPFVIVNGILIDGTTCEGEIIIPDSVTTIGTSAFYECETITSVIIPETVTNIEHTAFNMCSNLTSITIPANANIEGAVFLGTPWLDKKREESPLVVVNDILIDGRNCSGDIVIPDNVKTISDNAFYRCEDITSVIISDGVKNIDYYAFGGCINLVSIQIPDSVENIGSWAFSECFRLTSLEIPNKVKNIYEGTIYGCTGLKEIIISDSVEYIDIRNFAECHSLTSIKVSSNNKKYTSKDNVLFNKDKTTLLHYAQGNKNETYIIPQSVNIIGNSAFWNSNITSLTIPRNVVNVGSYAFAYCENLSLITIENPECEIYDEDGTICNRYGIDSYEFNGTIYGYPNSTAQAYAEKYNRKFVALEEKPAVEIVDSGECGAEGDNVVWQLDSEGTLTISGEGEMKNYDFEEDAPWYREYYQEGGVTKVIIEDGVTSIGDMAFNECVYLTSITIPDSVTSIGFRAFYWTALDSVTIPDSVTTIGEDAFSGCSKLDTITIPDSVTAIGNNAFEQTPWLEIRIAENPLVTVNNILIDGTACKGDITIPENITHIVTSAFSKSEELTAIYVDENNKNYTSENGVLFNKNKTTLVSYPIGNTAKEYTIPDGVVNIEDEAFFRCENLTSVIIPDGVKNIGNYAFYWCNGLLSVDISDTVESIGEYAFNNCNDLISIKIPDSVTSLGMAAVSSCYGLETAEIGNGVRKIDDYTFSYCKNLTFVTIGNNVEHIGELAFQACQKLESVTIPDSVISIGNSAFKGCSSLSSIEIPANVETIDKYAFESCDDLKSITIYNPDCFIDSDMYDTLYSTAEIATIYGYKGSTAQSYARDNKLDFIALDEEKPAVEIVASGECGAEGDNLTWTFDSEGTLTVSGTGEMDSWALNSPWSEHSDKITKVIIEKGVTAIGEQAFADCTALTSATISDSVTSIGDYAFYSCDSLTTITIPDSVTSIGDKAFQYCENLTSINVDSENKNYVSEDGVLFTEDKSMLIHYPVGKTAEEYIIPDGVTSIVDEAFSGCNSLTTITIPDSVTSIGDKAFSDFTGLTTITIPDSVTSIGDEAFSDCISLTTITIPDSVTSIGDSVFCYCVSLTSITIPDSVTSIGSNAFTNCGSLATITIPDSVTSIGSNAFSNCTSLATITIPDSVTSIGNNAFIFCENLTTITINNPECTIYDSEITISDTAEIHGYENSTAQAYAEKYNRKFVSLGEKPAVEIVASGECGAEGDNVTWKLDGEGTLTISGTDEMDSWALNSPWSEHSDKITKVIIEKGVTVIGEQAFSGCEKISEITIPDSVTNIKTGAFFDCTGLTSIKIPESVTEMGHSVFYGCVNLKEVTLPSGVGSINIGVFRDCQSLETITFSKNVKKVDFTALCGCSNLKSVIFEHPGCRIADAEHTICNSHDFDTEENVFNGTIYGYPNSTAQAYAEKYNRTFVALEGKPAIEIIDSGECGVMEEDGVSWMFDSEGTLTISGAWGSMYFHDNNIPWNKYQKDIVKVVVEKGVTGIEVAAFSYCTNLKSVTISDDIMYIGPYAFCGCTSLESIVIPDGVTDIEYSTFRDCINLTSVTLPESIIEIGHSAFEGCEKLASITLKNPECVIDDVKNTIPDTTVIYGCENSEVQAYAEKYNIKFVALEDKPAAELGDVNEDGKVDSSDASLVLEEYAVIQTGGAGAFTENQKKAADVNNDGKTDSSDASKILEYYAMISTGKEPSWD